MGGGRGRHLLIEEEMKGGRGRRGWQGKEKRGGRWLSGVIVVVGRALSPHVRRGVGARGKHGHALAHERKGGRW